MQLALSVFIVNKALENILYDSEVLACLLVNTALKQRLDYYLASMFYHSNFLFPVRYKNAILFLTTSFFAV